MSKITRTPPNQLSMPNLVSGQSVSESDLFNKPETSNANMRGEKRPRLRYENEHAEDFFSDFKQEIKEMIVGLISSQNSRIESLEKHLENTVIDENYATKTAIENSLGTISSQITMLQNNIKNLEEDRNKTAIKLNFLENKLENIERITRKTNIEIRNVPATTKISKEMLYPRIQKLLHSCQINLEDSQIKDVYAVPAKNKRSMTIVAELPNTLIKEKLLLCLRERGKKGFKLDTSILGIDGPSTPVFVSENLTPITRKIHALARTFCKNHNYKFCWIKNGKVYIRKSENLPALSITDEATIAELEQKA